MKKQYDDMEPIPENEYQSYQCLIARVSSIWAKAKNDNDYNAFAPTLAQIEEFLSERYQ